MASPFALRPHPTLPHITPQSAHIHFQVFPTQQSSVTSPRALSPAHRQELYAGEQAPEYLAAVSWRTSFRGEDSISLLSLKKKKKSQRKGLALARPSQTGCILLSTAVQGGAALCCQALLEPPLGHFLFLNSSLTCWEGGQWRLCFHELIEEKDPASFSRTE